MSNSDLVRVEISAGVASVVLNRPDQRNAINPEMADGLRSAFDQIEANPEVRVSVLSGAGPVFCAGMDLKSFTKGEADAILNGPHRFAGFVARERRKPVIAAVHGAALAGGFEIMLACDLVVASQEAIFGLPEVTLGLVAGGGGAIRLAQRVPRVLANELLLTGKTYPAAEMLRWGLINRVVAQDELADAALELASEIARNAPLSVTHCLALSDRLFRSQEGALWQANDSALAALSDTQDVTEGIAAFFEKRAPDWSGT
ncbi:enoyl-CoA hydratase-related protein [Thioclava sp.]|uniref:enoyl-CoA hydratase-related protein n=1 Tax=Thioclava sp. TaxID=1933450 RepID=UPI003AA8DDE3